MKLNEILDKPYPYELEETDGDWFASFKDDADEMVGVRFEFWGGPELYIVDFKRKGSFEMTNDSPSEKNQAVRIMATVTAIIKDFVKRTNAKFIAFSSRKSETSRSSLYTRIVNRIAPAIGYEIVKNPADVKHRILPGWWANKIKMSSSYDFTLLADKNRVEET